MNTATIDRNTALCLAHDAVSRAFMQGTPEAEAFVNVIATSPAVARGGVIDENTGIGCPLNQAGLWASNDHNPPSEVFTLALRWDRVTGVASYELREALTIYITD